MKFIVSTKAEGKDRKICVVIENVDCTLKNIVRDILQSVTDYYVTSVDGLIKHGIKKHVFNDLASAIRFLQEFKFYHHQRVTEITYNHTIVSIPSNWTLDLWRNRVYITPVNPDMVATDELVEACRIFLQALLKGEREIRVQWFLADYKEGVCFYFVDPTCEDYIKDNNIHVATSKNYNFIQPVISGESYSIHDRHYHWNTYNQLIEALLEETK